MKRGDVVLVFYPFASGAGGKRRPGLVVQNDADNSRMAATIVAQITTNLARAGEPSHLLIDASTKDGLRSGLLHRGTRGHAQRAEAPVRGTRGHAQLEIQLSSDRRRRTVDPVHVPARFR